MPVANDDLYAQSWNRNFGSNPFDDGPSEYSQDTEDTKYTTIQMPDDNRPPSPGSSKSSGRSPVEQTTEPDQNYNNHENEIPQHISENTPLQEEPINTRGENITYAPTLTQTSQTPIDTKNKSLTNFYLNLRTRNS